MKKIIKIIIILIFCLSVVLNIILIVKDWQFPIKYMVCDLNYENCFVSARFKNVLDCEIKVEMGNWYCDQTNPNNIQCRVSELGEGVTNSFCTK